MWCVYACMYMCMYVSSYVGPVMCDICLELLKINLVWKSEPEDNRLEDSIRMNL
jgi:hypothetical protein